jgi:hypothetical protein
VYRFYEGLVRLYFLGATVALFAFATTLLIGACWTVAQSVITGAEPADQILDSIGLIIIGFAVVETAKFMAEEELIRQRELRSAKESRHSLTKFITIVVIAGSLEALVMVFKTSRGNIADAIYPAILFIAAMLALAALGAYQWLSSKVEPSGEPTHTKDEQTGG